MAGSVLPSVCLSISSTSMLSTLPSADWTSRACSTGVLNNSAIAINLRKRSVICSAGKSPEDFSQTGKDKDEDEKESEFVAPRVTPDYVGKNSIKPPPRVEKKLEGPWITRWGGNVRGGKYQMGQGADRIIEIFANGDAMLIAAGGLIVLFFVLLQFRPDAPPPPS